MAARAVDVRRMEKGKGGANTINHNSNSNNVKNKGEKNNNVILYLAIVDIMQECGTVLKRVENVLLKSFQSDATAAKPKEYSLRFQELISTVFPEYGSSSDSFRF